MILFYACSLEAQTKQNPHGAGLENGMWLGCKDSNLDSWYQKPESCHWTTAHHCYFLFPQKRQIKRK
jgi:hypothetical protein